MHRVLSATAIQMREVDAVAIARDVIELAQPQIPSREVKLALELEEENYPSMVTDGRLLHLDLMMPVMDGWEFLEVLKNEHRVLATMPIVVAPAAAEFSRVQEEYGCQIMKTPVSIQTLIALAHEYCGSA